MKIDTLGVQAFVAIAEHGRFQKAADALSITQTALTRRLQNLERYLGVTLVERTTRSIGLTRIGHDFLPRARRSLGELAGALAGHQLIVAGPGSSNRPVLDRVSGTVDVLSSFYEVQRSSTAVGLVAEGLGAAIVPRMAMQDGAFPNLRIVPLVEPVVYKHLVLIVRRNAQLSPAAQALHALIRENAR